MTPERRALLTRLKTALSLLGLLVALLGVGLESRAVVWIAIGILALTFPLRVAIGRRTRE